METSDIIMAQRVALDPDQSEETRAWALRVRNHLLVTAPSIRVFAFNAWLVRQGMPRVKVYLGTVLTEQSREVK